VRQAHHTAAGLVHRDTLAHGILAVQEEPHESFVDHGDALGAHAITIVQRTALQHPDPEGLEVFGGHHLDPHAERPTFFHTHVIEMYQGAIDNLLAAVRQAIKLVEDNPGARAWKKSITELRRIERRKGFSAGARGSNRK